MGEYKTPGVYIEDVSTVALLDNNSTTVGAFVGITQRGEINKPVLITSWNGYIEKFAYGLSSPFFANSDLAFAVYGFFQNGGKSCYIVRTEHTELVASEAIATASSASLTWASGHTPTNVPVIKAKEEGVWGDKLKLYIVANSVNTSNFDVYVYYDTTIDTTNYSKGTVEIFRNLSNSATDAYYWIDIINGSSNYIKAVSGSFIYNNALEVPSAVVTFTGGVDAYSQLLTADWTASLTTLDAYKDFNMICMPGQTTASLNGALKAYAEGRDDCFAIFDLPLTTVSASEAITTKRSVETSGLGTSDRGCVVYPWVRVSNPLSPTGQSIAIPACGHVMGVFSRIIAARGVWKAPAGTEAVIRGVIECVYSNTDADVGNLNTNGIIPLVVKNNVGIVVWGARSLSDNKDYTYTSDCLLDIYIKKSLSSDTSVFVFESNDRDTWGKIKTVCESFLDTLWRSGGLKGETAKEAYYVKCDSDINTQDTINRGLLFCDIGYARKKPNEFIVFRISHEVSSV